MCPQWKSSAPNSLGSTETRSPRARVSRSDLPVSGVANLLRAFQVEKTGPELNPKDVLQPRAAPRAPGVCTGRVLRLPAPPWDARPDVCPPHAGIRPWRARGSHRSSSPVGWPHWPS